MRGLHIGPGRLGLGLVAQHLIEVVGCDLILVGRPPSATSVPEQRAFFFEEYDRGTGQRRIPAVGAGNAGTVDQLPALAQSWISDGTPLLITCALGDQADSCEELVRGIVGGRPAEAETVLIACENDEHDVYGRLARIGSKLHVCRAVVDRVCISPRDDARRPDGRRQVQAHSIWEWIVEGDDGIRSETLDELCRHGVGRTANVDPDKQRKLWGVNGTHQMLALVSRRLGVEKLGLAASHPDFVERMTPLTEAFRDALLAAWPDEPLDDSYFSDRIRVFAEMPDTTKRILGAHLVRENCLGLLDRLDQRIFAAARAISAAREPDLPSEIFAPFVDTAELLIDVVADGDLFYPADDDVALVEDDVVVRRFATLLDGWVTHDVREDLVRRFAEALAVTA